MKNSATYRKAYRFDPAGQMCQCGKPAVKYHNGGFACAACITPIKAVHNTRDYSGKVEYKSKAKVHKAQDFWERNSGVPDKTGIGWGSLEILEGMLNE